MKKKVVVYSSYSPEKPGAAGMRVHYLKEALQKKGFGVRVLTPRDAQSLGLVWAIWKEKPCLVIGTSPPLPPTFWAYVGAKLANAVFVLDAKDDGRAIRLLNKENRSWKEKAFLVLRKFLYVNADQAWFLTLSDQKEALRHYSVSLTKSTLVPNGVDERISFSDKKRNAWRKKWGLSTQTKVLLYAGSIGDEDMVGMLEMLPHPSSTLFLVLVLAHDSTLEDEQNKERIGKILHEKKWESHSKILVNQPVSQMSGFFSAADVGLIPWKDFLRTSIPVKLFDYAGTGLPCVVKGPSASELAFFIQKNPFLGEMVSDWDDFYSTLQKLLRKQRTQKERHACAMGALEKWNRKKIASIAVEKLVGDFSKLRRN